MTKKKESNSLFQSRGRMITSRLKNNEARGHTTALREGPCCGWPIYLCSDQLLKNSYLKNPTYKKGVMKELSIRARLVSRTLGKEISTVKYIQGIK